MLSSLVVGLGQSLRFCTRVAGVGVTCLKDPKRQFAKHSTFELQDLLSYNGYKYGSKLFKGNVCKTVKSTVKIFDVGLFTVHLVTKSQSRLNLYFDLFHLHLTPLFSSLLSGLPRKTSDCTNEQSQLCDCY